MMNPDKFRLNKISTALSILCVVDCTLIPLMLFLLSVFNIFDDKVDILHDVTEIISLYIMVPISSLCIIFNFYQLRNFFLLSWGILGVTLFTIAHGHYTCFGESINLVLHEFHIIISLFSIFLILSNNYVSQRLLKKRNLHYCCLSKHRHETNDKEKKSLKIPMGMFNNFANNTNAFGFRSSNSDSEFNECSRSHSHSHSHTHTDNHSIDDTPSALDCHNVHDDHTNGADDQQNQRPRDNSYKSFNNSELELVCFLNSK